MFVNFILPLNDYKSIQPDQYGGDNYSLASKYQQSLKSIK